MYFFLTKTNFDYLSRTFKAIGHIMYSDIRFFEKKKSSLQSPCYIDLSTSTTHFSSIVMNALEATRNLHELINSQDETPTSNKMGSGPCAVSHSSRPTWRPR